MGSLVKGNQKNVDPLTGTSVVFAISDSLNSVGTEGIRYWPAAANGAAASTAETPPITFRKSLLDIPGFLPADAPSNAVG